MERLGSLPVMLLINHIPLVMLGCLSNRLFKIYPAEYMAAVLSNNMVISSRLLFMEECSVWDYKFWGPDVNESIIIYCKMTMLFCFEWAR
jgi:hypothetical protein